MKAFFRIERLSFLSIAMAVQPVQEVVVRE
jgi:hypothetical protein